LSQLGPQKKLNSTCSRSDLVAYVDGLSHTHGKMSSERVVVVVVVVVVINSAGALISQLKLLLHSTFFFNMQLNFSSFLVDASEMLQRTSVFWLKLGAGYSCAGH